MKITRFTLCILLAAIVWTAGCVTQKSNPLAGWKVDLDHDPNKAIEKDYQDYIQKLPQEKRQFVSTVHFLEDGTGLHAINIEIGVNGTWWEHVLIYDKDNKRIKTIKYSNGGYRS